MIEPYADAECAGNPSDRWSTSGYYVFFRSDLVQRSFRKQRVVALSSAKARYKAPSHVSIELAWLKNLLAEIQASSISKLLDGVTIRMQDL